MQIAQNYFPEIKHHNQLTEIIITKTKGCFTLAERSILSYLASQGFWDKENKKSKNIKVSVSDIQKNTDISRRAVFYILKKLKQMKILEVSEAPTLQTSTPSTFTIEVEVLEKHILNHKNTLVQNCTPPSAKLHPLVHHMHYPSAPHAPLLINNNKYIYNNNSACAREDDNFQKTAEIINFPNSAIRIPSLEKQIANERLPKNPLVTINAPKNPSRQEKLDSCDVGVINPEEDHSESKISALRRVSDNPIESDLQKPIDNSKIISVDKLDKTIFLANGIENGIHSDWIDIVFQEFLVFNQKRNYHHTHSTWMKFWLMFCNRCFDTYKNPKPIEIGNSITAEDLFPTDEPMEILDFRKKLCDKIGTQKYIAWFKELEICIENNVLFFYTVGNFKKDYILNNFAKELECIINGQNGLPSSYIVEKI